MPTRARMDKLTDEVATLQKVLAAQNQATASIQREWRVHRSEVFGNVKELFLNSTDRLVTMTPLDGGNTPERRYL